MMEGTSLFSLLEGMQVSHIQITEDNLVVEVVTTSLTSRCPLCSQASESIHCRYRRILRDVPCAGRCVQLVLTVRKFSCRNPLCQRKVFAERIPTFMEPWARMTIRYCQQTSILYLGIDDFSFRRGSQFGTILVDLESRRVVDLLPDREAKTSAAWMRQHPDLMAVSRDRGGEYASAARKGAPQAMQYADRFHLLKNLREAFNSQIYKHTRRTRHVSYRRIF